jgi:hypothetical protein
MRQLPCLILLSLPLAAATIDDVKREAAVVRELANETKLEGFTRSVPLTNLKRAVRDWIEANLGDGSEAQAKRLNEQITSDGLGELKCASQEGCMWDNQNGYLGPVRFLLPAPGYLVVETKLGMFCGYDASHYLYRRTGQRWERLIDAEQTDYSENGFQPIDPHHILLSSSGSGGERLFAIVGENPWCTSCWNRIYIRVWRLEGNRVKQVLNRQRGAYRCTNDTVDIGPDHIRIDHIGATLVADFVSRKHIQNFTYRPQEQSLVRDTPLAHTALDFVDEWLNNPWEEISRWSVPALENTHHLLKGDDHVFGELPEVSRCPSGGWQVSVRLEKPTPAVHHFLVSEHMPLHFRMESVSATPAAGCTPVREP